MGSDAKLPVICIFMQVHAILIALCSSHYENHESNEFMMYDQCDQM